MLLEIAAGAQIVTSNSDAQASYADGEDESAFERAKHVVRCFQEAMWGRLQYAFLTDLDRKVVLSPGHGDVTASHKGQHVEHPDFVHARDGAAR